MSNDHLQDAFPILFNFRVGELPTSEKFSGLVKFVDQGFSNVTEVVGDPRDATTHTFDLSPEKLAQNNLARIIGPSDYLSPIGGCWQEPITQDLVVTLISEKNCWELGFPLVTTSSTIDPSEPKSSFTDIDWDTYVTISGGSGVLDTRETDIEDVTSDGDFHVDFERGIITAYCPSTADITLTISSSSNLCMLSAGVPWGTHNVIPTWEETSYLCDITKVGTVGSTTQYTLTLPTVLSKSRLASSGLYGGRSETRTRPNDAICSAVTASGYSSNYRLPYSIANQSAGILIPSGYVLLWDNFTGRVVPSVSFYTLSANSLTLYTSVDYLTEGNNTYRLIVPGTSVAEAVGWLLGAFRDNRHDGLSSRGFSGTSNLRFSQTLEHGALQNLYSGFIDSSFTDADRWKFTCSNYPINPHSQYLHRGGYMSDDEDGNSANSMRGDLVFTGDIDNGFTLGYSSQRTYTYGIAWGSPLSGTSGGPSLSFQGGGGLTSWKTKDLQGGDSNPTSDQIGFCIYELGASPYNGVGYSEWYGALSLDPWNGTPLYLRGQGDSSSTGINYRGAVLGFDLGHRSELNYIKIMKGIRDGSYDHPNMPAERTQTDPDTQLAMTPNLKRSGDGGPLGQYASVRLASEQVREFRFRAGPYVSLAKNVADGLGAKATSPNTRVNSGGTVATYNIIQAVEMGAGNDDYVLIDDLVGNYFIVGRQLRIRGTTYNNQTSEITSVVETSNQTKIYIDEDLDNEGIATPGSPAIGTVAMYWGEFDTYFTSPSIVGSDFLNVYSNAIFFSDYGDGKTTSFTNYGDDFFDSDNNWTKAPTGMYYLPDGIEDYGGISFAWDNDDKPFYSFTVRDTISATSATQPLMFGDDFGFVYSGDGDAYFVCGSTLSDRRIKIGAATFSKKMLLATVGAAEDLGVLTCGSGSDITLQTVDGKIDLYAYSSGATDRDINIKTFATSTGVGDINIISDVDGDVNIKATYDSPDGGNLNLNAKNIYIGTSTSDTTNLTIGNLVSPVRGNAKYYNFYSYGVDDDDRGFSFSAAAGGDIRFYSTDDIRFNTDDFSIFATGDFYVTCGTNDAEIYANDIRLRANDDILLETAYSSGSANNGRIYAKVGYSSTLGGIPGVDYYELTSAGTVGFVIERLPTTGGGMTVRWNQNSGKLYVLTSSERIKENIQTVENIDWLYDINPVTFTEKNDEFKRPMFGLIAEQVEKVQDMVVQYNNQGLVLGINYEQLIAPLIKAVQDQKKEIEELKSKLNK